MGISHRELAQTIRRLPDRYHGRLPAGVLQRFVDAAAAAQWEKAVDDLITALYARVVPVTAAKREELREVLEAHEHARQPR